MIYIIQQFFNTGPSLCNEQMEENELNKEQVH